MKFRTVVIIVLLIIGCTASQRRNLLHSGASDYLACHNAEGEPAYAEDDTSEAAVACRETFGGGD